MLQQLWRAFCCLGTTRKPEGAEDPPAKEIEDAPPFVLEQPYPVPREDALLSLEHFQNMQRPIWLMLMDMLSPLDLLNLAHAHPLFKDLITRSPKRWGTVEEIPKSFSKPVGRANGKVYIIRTRQGSWDRATSYILFYGDVYGYMEAEDDGYQFLTGAYKGRCQYVPPGADRDGPAKVDLFILLNNATLDEYGFGTGWKLPTIESYAQPPRFRVHMAMLDIKGPKQDICKKIVPYKPSSVAVHADCDRPPGELRALVLNLTKALPNLQLFWIHVGHHISSLRLLLDIKAPSIIAGCWLDQRHVVTREDRLWNEVKYVVRCTYIKQLLPNLEPTLAAMILQWERGQRQIDHIVLHSHSVSGDNMVDWDKLTPLVAELAGKLARGKTGAVSLGGDSNTWLIRRHRWSNEGLLIAVRPKMILIVTCDYTFRRGSPWTDWHKYNRAIDRAEVQLRPRRLKVHYDEELNMWSESVGELELLFHKRKFEAGVKQFHAQAPFCSIPKRELAIHQFLDNPAATRFLLEPEFGLESPYKAVDHVVKYYAQNQYAKEE